MPDYESSTSTPWYSCSGSIEKIVIEEGVTSVGSTSFYGCDKLIDVRLPDGLEKIGEFAFEECGKLTDINFPEGLKTIGESAFCYCTSLSSVSFNEGLEVIGLGAFSTCALKLIYIPDSVKTIGDFAFVVNSELTEIVVGANNSEFSSEDGIIFDKNKTTVVFYPAGKTGEKYTVPEGITAIGNGAFYMNSHLKEIILPDNLNAIGEMAFVYCNSLQSVYIPASVKKVGSSAFVYCGMLETVYFNGTQVQWKKIAVKEGNEVLLGAEIQYNYCRHKNKIHHEKVTATCVKKGAIEYWSCPDCSKNFRDKACEKEETDISVAKAPENHVHTKRTDAVEATFVSVGFTAGVYCNDCKKYISGHEEIPVKKAVFTDSTDAVLKDNNVFVSNDIPLSDLISQAGENAYITNPDGTKADKTQPVSNGMILNMPDGKKYVIVVLGDVDADGRITAKDARIALRASVELEKIEINTVTFIAADVEKDGKITARDARRILRASVELENPADWIKE